MKTVVVGVFDQLADAGRVIAQLAASPLDMDTVQVVHSEAAVQERLSAEAGLPPRRAALSTLLAGAALGGLAGFWFGGGLAAADAADGATALLPNLGPLPGLALGLVLGAAFGLLAALFGERTEIPEQHRAGLLQALREGATVVTVRTENLPTARAIGDLFRAGGSRLLPDGSAPGAAASEGGGGPVATGALSGASVGGPDGGPPASHQAFVPPWRRGSAGEAADEGAPAAAPSPAADPVPPTAFTLFPEAGDAGPGAPPEPAAGAAAITSTPAAGLPGQGSPPPDRTLRHGDVVIGRDTTSRPLQMTEVAPLPADRAGFVPRPEGSQMAAAEPPLEALGLPARIVRALQAAQVRDTATLRQMAVQDQRALDLIPGIGPMAQKQIRIALGLEADAPAPDA